MLPWLDIYQYEINENTESFGLFLDQQKRLDTLKVFSTERCQLRYEVTAIPKYSISIRFIKTNESRLSS